MSMMLSVTTSPGPVASAVRAELARRGLTQHQAAEHLGISRQALGVRLRGSKDFPIGELLRLAAWLDVPLTTLIGEHPGVRIDAVLPHQSSAQAVSV